jgi:hypothetical protein
MNSELDLFDESIDSQTTPFSPQPCCSVCMFLVL